MGVAVSIGEDLIVPCIKGCDKLKIADITRRRSELVKKAREGKLSLKEVSNGTFTVTNLGMYQVRSFSPIINPPQGAILAVGEIYIEPAAVNGKIEPRWIMRLSLVFDHRVYDGVPAAQFLQTLKGILERPYELLV